MLNPINGQFCPVCGCDSFQQIRVDSDFLFVGTTLFQVKGYPGLVCKDCKEVYIHSEIFKLFVHALSEGNYEPIEQHKVSAYSLEKECLGSVKHVPRVLSDGTIVAIMDVPFITTHGYEEIEHATLKEIYQLHKKIESEHVHPNREIDLVIVQF